MLMLLILGMVTFTGSPLNQGKSTSGRRIGILSPEFISSKTICYLNAARMFSRSFSLPSSLRE